MIYRPLYLDKIMAYVDTPFVKILTGVRRCGKSTILKMIMERLKMQWGIPEERIVSCRYDSMEYEDMTAKQMYSAFSWLCACNTRQAEISRLRMVAMSFSRLGICPILAHSSMRQRT